MHSPPSKIIHLFYNIWVVVGFGEWWVWGDGKHGGSVHQNIYTFYSHPTRKTKTMTDGSIILSVVDMTGLDGSFA